MPPAITQKYENLRENVSPELSRLPDRRLTEVLAERNIDAEAMESFLDDVGKFAAKAAPAILPIAGQVVGGIYGGPAGAAIGGQLGSLAGGAITSATGQRTAASGAVGSSAPAGAIQQGAGSPAANQLLQIITRPEVLQAIAAMAMGSAGKSNISVGSTQVPVGAFSNLVGVLAGHAEAEYNESMAHRSVPQYMMDYAGEAKGDPAVEEHRAGALFELLAEQIARTEPERESETETESESLGPMEFSESEADAIEMLELAYELNESEWD